MTRPAPAMSPDDFPAQFRRLYDLALARHARGERNAAAFFTGAEQAALAAHGLAPQHLYDYAEDQLTSGEPGYDQALAIELVRRDYFLRVQGGRPSGTVLDAADLPDKTAEIRGLVWLPRLIPKARAKLRGELPPTLMYGCGGDRRFFRAHGLLPAEFLARVWRHGPDEAALVDWVVRRGAG